MEVFSKIFSSMLSQNIIGWMVIVFIIAMFIVGLVSSMIIKKYYRNLKNEVNLYINSGNYSENTELCNIVEEFSKSTIAGTDNINTEVIIDRHLNNKVLRLQSISKIIPGTLIGLGLLGTFLGLTLAIFETKGALNGIENINTFSNALQSPIASMATAFWTSIFGVIGSIVLNLSNQSISYYRIQFYTEIENYLDNEVFSRRAKTFNTIFEEFSITVKTTMLTLTEEMTVLFKNGVEELVNKINSNSIDLTNSAEALKDYTEKFKELVCEMDNTVKNFDEPVDKFNNSVKDFVVISEGLEKSFNDNFSQFNGSVNNLDNSMLLLSENLNSSFKDFEDVINNSSTILTENIKENSFNVINRIEESLTGFSEGIKENGENIACSMDKTLVNFSNKIDENIDKTEEKFKGFIDDVAIGVNKSINNIEESLAEFSGSIKESGENASNSIEKTLVNFSGEIAGNIDKTEEKFKGFIGEVTVGMNKSFGNIEKSLTGFTEDIKESGENVSNSIERILVNFSNEITNTIGKTGKEFKESMNEVATGIDKSFSKNDELLTENISGLNNLIMTIKNEGDLTESRANTLNGLISTINSINEIRDNENAEQMDMLKDTYEKFIRVVNKFNESFSNINSAIAGELEKALNQKFNEIGKEFSKNLADDINLVVKEISDSAENLNDSVSIVGELVKASNDWASAVAYSLNEVGSDKLR